MGNAGRKNKSTKVLTAFVLGMSLLFNSQSVWAYSNNVNTSTQDYRGDSTENKSEAKVQKAESVGTMLVFNAESKAPTLAGVTNKTDGVITNQEYDAARDAASTIRSELKNAWTQDVQEGYSGLVWTTRERKVIDDEVIERVMEKLEKCNPDDVGAMLIPGSETLAGKIQTKAGSEKILIKEGRAPRFVIDSFDVEYRTNMAEEEQEWKDAFNEYRDPDPEKYPGNEVKFETGGLNAEAFEAIVKGNGDWSDNPPVYDWDDNTKTIVNTYTKQYTKVIDGEDAAYELKDLFEWAPWFTYGYQKRMYDLIKDKAYVESDEFEVSPEIQFYPGSVEDIWEAFEDIVAIGNSDFIHVSTIKNYIIDSVIIGDVTSKRPVVEESFWEIYQIDENGNRYNSRFITGDINGNLNVAFDAPGTYYIKQTIPAYITYGNTYYYTYEEYTVEESTGIILDYQTKTDKAYVKYTEPRKGLTEGARYVQPITEEQCNKNWIVTPDSIRMGNNLYMVE